MSASKLFQSIKVGNVSLSHRVVMAPLTRFRASKTHVPSKLAAEYYGQRASAPGTLLITEATFISPEAGGYDHVPGIWSEEQITGWKAITDAVHTKGSFIFLQLWALGRAAGADQLQAEGSYPYTGADSIGLTDKPSAPRPLSTSEIKEYVNNYGTAASNAIRAGFDGVEIHGANGYLVDQFLQDVSNKRTDAYGGSIENRSRFGIEAIDAVVKAVGAERAAIRFSPWSKMQDMGMEDPIRQFSHIISHIKTQHPNFAYIHLVEPRVDGYVDRKEIPAGHSNDFARKIWAPKPVISAGGYTPEIGIEVADKKGDLIAYGRSFISNPDLPQRIKNGWPLEKGDRKLYYLYGSTDPHGYTDYAPYNTSSAKTDAESHL